MKTAAPFLWLTRHSQETPLATAIDAPGRAPLTYAALERLVTGTAATLRDLGIGPDDCVATVVPDGPEALTTFLGVASCAAAAPVNPNYQTSELVAHLTTVEARMLVTALGPESAAVQAAASLGLPVVHVMVPPDAPAGSFFLETAGTQRSSRAPALDDSRSSRGATALILTTSGTTARPKVVPLTHANLQHSAEAIAASLSLSPRDRCLQVMPFFHVHGLVGGALASLVAGGSVICPSGFDATKFFAQLEACQPTWYTAAPTLHHAIVARAARHRAFLDSGQSKLRFVRSCSAALPVQTRLALAREFRVPIVEAYGMTEASHQISSTPLDAPPEKAGSVGVPTGTIIAIIKANDANDATDSNDANGAHLPVGHTGEIAVRGAGLTAGYRGSPDATARAFADGWFRTGDLGRVDHAGYLFITGRVKEIINRGGEKVSPFEVEEILRDHPAIAEVAAFAIPDDRLGETVGAAVVLEPDAHVDEGQLRRFAAVRLAPFKVPERIAVVAAIPKGPTGKVQRIGLARALGLDERIVTAEVKHPPAATDRANKFMRRVLAAIWCEVLDVETIGEDVRFFEAGGDSILAQKILARVRDHLHVDLSIVDLFEHPTIAEMAARIAGGTQNRASNFRPQASGLWPQTSSLTTASLSAAQRRLWFLEQWQPGNAAYHDVLAFRLRGALDDAALERCFASLVERHAVLRTSFSSVDGEPTAAIARSVRAELVRRTAIEAQAAEVATAYVREPFDVTSAPLMRQMLLTLDHRDHLLIVVFHHLICDGASLRILERDLAALYRAEVEGRPATLPALPLTYAEHATFEAAWTQSADAAKELTYWRGQLDPMPPPLELPSDRPRRPVQGYDGSSRTRVLAADLHARVTEFARRESATPFMVYAAAFAALLGRLARQDDIILGVPIAGRRDRSDEDLVGPFANTLALRVDLAGDPTFRTLLARVRRRALDAYAHQRLPFDALVEALQPERRLDRAPIVQALLNYRNMTAHESVWTGLDVEPYAIETNAAIADLMMDVVPNAGDGIRVRIDYDTDLFDATTIDRWLGHFEQLLAASSASPETPLSAFDVSISVGGTIDRAALPAPASAASRRSAPASPETPTERTLADIWAAVLQTAGPGIDDDFFALGGHSLLAVRVIARVNDTFGVALSIRQLFETPTVRRLARAVDECPRVARAPIRAVDRTTLGRRDVRQ